MNPKTAAMFAFYRPSCKDGHEVLTATSTSGNPNAWSRVFPGIWAHSSCRLLLNDDIERLTLALVVAAAVAPRCAAK